MWKDTRNASQRTGSGDTATRSNQKRRAADYAGSLKQTFRFVEPEPKRRRRTTKKRPTEMAEFMTTLRNDMSTSTETQSMAYSPEGLMLSTDDLPPIQSAAPELLCLSSEDSLGDNWSWMMPESVPEIDAAEQMAATGLLSCRFF